MICILVNLAPVTPETARVIGKSLPEGPGGEIVVYETSDGEVQVDVRLDRETVWLTQRQIAAVFGTSIDNVGLHLKNVYSSGELAETATAEEYSVLRTEGKRRVRRTLKHYNLDVIVSVGYRVNSRRGVRFRQWATRHSAGPIWSAVSP